MKKVEKNGVIYILKNPSFPNYVKIGYADDIDKRLQQLNRSECIPFAFRVYATYEVDSRLSDIKIHSIIDKLNPELRSVESFNGKQRVREFYAMTPEDAYSILEAIAEIHGYSDRLKLAELTDEDKEAEEAAKEIQETTRRGPFRFGEHNIPVGAELTFVDDESITVTVVDDRHIEFDGEVTSLSALAKKLKDSKYPLQGTLYFKYEGRVLNDIRESMTN